MEVWVRAVLVHGVVCGSQRMRFEDAGYGRDVRSVGRGYPDDCGDYGPLRPASHGLKLESWWDAISIVRRWRKEHCS
ncbi:hypothetical protein P280DRAFT_474246 [Massarina eburnea CBS 473.64]|uniref:Uncharacterized protein n=1 Tax=Massarina eburnea CBS 473.64 TaxID=1395130 RepID=A0A6A6RI59_9PLEO|nr:hypothetical protein P280DRAFT_474246 [Massarina eburnea CBS 473.64]